jgi:putative acetyltransferase
MAAPSMAKYEGVDMSTTAEVPTGIVIRAQQDGDAPALAAIRNDPRARWGTLATPFETVESAKRRAAMEPGRTELVACVDGKVVGMAGIFRKPQARRAHVAEIGIMIRDGWQGKGIGTKLFAALTELADQWLNLRRLELSVYTDNAPAIALYRKFGFDIEATEVADAFRAGWFADSYVMARLVGEIALLAVHDEWHGNGVGAALMAAMVDIADNWLNLTRMQLGVIADNAPAIGLYRKFDFESEGLKRAEVFRAGAYADTMLMARRVRK